MPSFTSAPAIEAFHLAFLEVLRHQLNPARYVLKGGANLRYFFDSDRYSEDIDLDVFGVLGTTLEKNVDSVLSSRPLEATLRSTGLAVVTDEVSKPKQSDTTRRWKVPISTEGRAQPIRTKIEFSNRNGENRYELAAVPGRVVKPYGLRPPSVQHYLGQPATEQKVRALAGRSETQARDVFDLDLLLRKTLLEPGAVEADVRETAAERALELPFQAFVDQVAPFLDPEVAQLYDQSSWEQMQLGVNEALLKEDK